MTNRASYTQTLVEQGVFAPERWWFGALERGPDADGPVFVIGHPDVNAYGADTVVTHALEVSGGAVRHRSWSRRATVPAPVADEAVRLLDQAAEPHRPLSNLLRGLRVAPASQAAIDRYRVMAARGPLADHFALPGTSRGSWHLADVPLAPDGLRRWYVDLPFAFAAVHGGHVAAGTLPSPEEVAAIRARMADAGLAAVAACLDAAALAALAGCPSYGTAEYTFYAAPGVTGQRRRNSAAAFPVLTQRLAANEHLATAAAGNVSFQDAFARWLRTPFSTAHLRRLNALDIDNDFTFELACRCFAQLPPQWIPNDPMELEAALDVFSATRLLYRDLDGLHGGAENFLPPLRASGGHWSAYKALLERHLAASDAAPNRALRDRMSRAGRRVKDALTAFATEVLAPVLAHAGRRGDGALTTDDLRRAWALLCRGKGLVALFAQADQWHAELERCRARLPQPASGLDGRSWPALFAPWTAPNGLTLTCLETPLDLAEEGARGADRNGVPGLSHCVATYADHCLIGRSHIIAIRRPGGAGGAPYTRLSTAEMAPTQGGPGDAPTLCVQQHQGLHDRTPPVEAQQALRALQEAVRRREVALEPRALLPRRRGEAIARNALEAQCRYDWTDPDNVAQALIAWERLLPRGWRGRAVGDLAALFVAATPAAGPAAETPLSRPQ